MVDVAISRSSLTRTQQQQQHVLLCVRFAAAPDGVSVGDCPFAHAVRMALFAKGKKYEIRPCTQEAKPKWLVEHYEGKMPALKHESDCYVDSHRILEVN